MTTGKNKEQFRSWYFDNDMNAGKTLMDLLSFYHLPFEMQIGVYLAYFDSIGVKIATPTNGKEFFYHIEINYENNQFESLTNNQYRTTVIEAYKHAFKKADELVNKQL